nr:MAG TPA: minor tail protein [Bacteriophage sp.]
MADGSITIDARLNKKGAESDLKALQAKVKSTSKQIGDLDKQLNSAQTKRSALGDSLNQARQNADDTAVALEKVNAQLENVKKSHLADIKSEYPGLSDSKVQDVLKSRMEGETSLLNQNQKLLDDLEKQDAKVAEIESDYNAQGDAISGLQKRHAALTAQLNQEKDAVNQQKSLIQHLSGEDDMQAYFNKQADAIESSFAKIENRQNKAYGTVDESATQHAERIVAETQKAVNAQDKAAQAAESRAAREHAIAAKSPKGSSVPGSSGSAGLLSGRITGLNKALSGTLNNALRTVGGLGARVFGTLQRAVDGLRAKLTQSSKNLAKFRNRLMSIVSGALVFNLISAGLRKITEWMGSAALSSATLRAALGNLQGAASTAAAPLLQAILPALTAIANAAATAFYYIAQLVSFLTGKSIGASQSAAKAMGKYAKAAKSAGSAADGALAKFDELDVLDKNSGGGAGAITPNYDFNTDNPFLDEIMQAIKDGDWYGVGQLIGEKLRDSLNAIPWPDIQDKARAWATNIANCINGFIEVPGLWEAIGHTVAQGLNTALIFADTLMQGIHWDSLGAGIARGLTTAVAELDWPLLGRVLTDGMRAAILTLYSFVQTYTGWADLGNSIAACINSAIANIPWTEAGLGLSGFVVGLLHTLIATVQGTDWTALGQNIVSMVSAIDWVGLFSAMSTLAIDVLQAINGILNQVDWDAVGQKIMECLEAVDWAGILSQLGEIINNNWPLLLAVLGAALLPQISTFILSTVLGAVLKALAVFIASVVASIGLWPLLLVTAVAVIMTAIIETLRKHGDDIRAGVDKFGETIADIIRSAGEKIKEIWDALWLVVKLIGMQLWEDITQGWNDFWTNIGTALDSAAADIQQGWNDAWTAVSDFVSDIWDGITDTIKTAINGIIGLVNGMISAIVGGVNGVIGVLNGFGFDVPEWAQDKLGVERVGFNIDPITAPQIPYLAQGAVIPANHEFLAVLGDQTNGTNIEAPLATIQQALAEVMEAYTGQQDITIRFAGDLAQLARVLKPYIDKEENRRGAKLVTGGVY